MCDENIFRKQASILIYFDGGIDLLAKKLSDLFRLESIKVASSEYAPHNPIGSAEALGWDIWLQNEPLNSNWYCLQLETEHSTQETFEDRMYDLSAWLCRYVAIIGDLETKVRPKGHPLA